MKKLKLFLMLVMFGFGMITAQTVEAVTHHVAEPPCEGTAADGSNVLADGGNCGLGPEWNARIAIAPYAQVVADNSYTFIGISHPSLATAHTSIGVVVEALNMVTIPNTSSGRAAVFTVSAGETHRVFLINAGHPTINLSNSAFTDTQTHLITMTESSHFGNVKVWAVGTHPNQASLNTADRVGGRYTSNMISNNDDGDEIYRFDNLNQLSMWGVVYQTANGAGFALEFIGDMHDSVSMPCYPHIKTAAEHVLPCGSHEPANGLAQEDTNTSGAGRGVN